MTTNTRLWLHKLVSAVIGGGAAAVTSGITSMGLAPDKFNIANGQGIGHLFELMAANFLVSGFLSAMFYLKQSPLPDEGSVTTTATVASVTTVTTPPHNQESSNP